VALKFKQTSSSLTYFDRLAWADIRRVLHAVNSTKKKKQSDEVTNREQQ
jgi:hypothetical protein